jgi:AraC-like DNA-binding protein
MAAAEPMKGPAIALGPVSAGEVASWCGVAYRVLYIEAGEVRLSLGGTVVVLQAGEALAAPPESRLSIERNSRVRGWYLAFMPDALDPPAGDAPHNSPLAGDARWLGYISPLAHGRPLVLQQDERRELGAHLGRLECELRHPARNAIHASRALVNLVLVQLSRAIARDPDFAAPIDTALLEILDFVDERLSHSLSLDRVARAVSRSPRQVSRIVKDQYGESVMALVERRRMEEAARLLRDTGWPVNLVAHAVGYSDPGYFRRRFRHRFGRPPGSWRAASSEPTAPKVPPDVASVP